MSNSQTNGKSQEIERAYERFKAMSTAEKKQFIANAQEKFKDKPKSPEMAKFLNDCIMDYNYEIGEGASVSATRTVHATPNAKSVNRDNFQATTDYVIADPAQRMLGFLSDMLFALPGIIFVAIQMFLSFNANELMQSSNRARTGWHFDMIVRGANVTQFVPPDPERAAELARTASTQSTASTVFGLLALIYFIYYTIKQVKYWKKGTSYGKNRRGMTVVNKDTGERTTTGYMVLREMIGKYISGLIFSLGWIWILIDKAMSTAEKKQFIANAQEKFKKRIEIEKSRLPKNAKEGSCIVIGENGVITVVEDRERQKRIADKMKSVWKR